MIINELANGELIMRTPDLPDYKWYCFDGEPRYCQVIKDRNNNETIDFFDCEWNHQDFVGLNPAAGPAAVVPARRIHCGSMNRQDTHHGHTLQPSW